MVKLVEITVIQAPIERCFDLARSVEVHLAGNIHSGESAVAIHGDYAGITSGLIGLARRVTWRAKHFGVWHTLTSEITAMDRPAYFQDTMIRGPFRSMQHDFAAPLPILGRVAEIAFLSRYMRTMLRERNEVIRQVAQCE